MSEPAHWVRDYARQTGASTRYGPGWPNLPQTPPRVDQPHPLIPRSTRMCGPIVRKYGFPNIQSLRRSQTG
jgi:hypothetical protein